MLKIAICDDETLILEKIESLLNKEFKKHKIKYTIKSFTDGEEILKTRDILSYDIIFLDIELKTSNGVKIAELLREKAYKGLIIFITSFMNYAPEGYKVNAFRFILKSNIDEQLSECISSIKNSIDIKKDSSFNDIKDIDDIVYVMSENHKLVIYLKDGREENMYMTLNKFEEEINTDKFYRIHQSYLVNINFVELVIRYEIKLSNGIELPISKSRYKKASKEIGLRKSLWG